MYLVQVSLLLIGQQGLGHFFMYQPFFLPIGWRIAQILCQHQREKANKQQPLLVQYKQQAYQLFSMYNYTPLVINGNDKNKQLTSLGQRKLAITSRNTLFILKKSLKHLKNIMAFN
jgi:hypothetical protein